ncbi:MAG: cation-translocating P-type ATPase [Proteobacteria bacterium]|nr:cation-translocating P-type ATPase [Pseudomonadota bacterium]
MDVGFRLKGLTQSEAAHRLQTYGPNELVAAQPRRVWQRLLRQFMSPLIYILLFALALDFVLWVHEGAQSVPYEAIAIALILSLNAGLGAYQEGKAEEALARLKALAKPSAWVVRDGVLLQIPARDLVPGDLARVEAGDRVPADGVLAKGLGVMVDESIVTGESLPIEKDIDQDLLSGTLLVRSSGYLHITRTGPRSTMGRLAIMIGGIEASQTPLEKRLGVFGNQVAIAIVAIGIVLILGGLLVEGISHIGQIVLFSVALAVAAVPEGLPAVLTLTLAMGVERLAKRKAVVRRLSAVEALGSVTVIATDKTGTLTENRMDVHAIDALDSERALQAIILANDAEIATGAGDPLEVALLNYAIRRGAAPADLALRTPRVSSRPFDSESKFMRVTVQKGSSRISYLKGAPEVLIQRSTLPANEKREWEAKALRQAREGYRVLALAWGHGEQDDDVTFLGLVMLWDPPRPEVSDALKRAQAAGIRVLMITGDHPATARAIGEVIGIAAERVVTGSEIERMSIEDIQNTARNVNVFARMAPEHKLRLVEALKANGEIVAVTGDGVNDAPALKRSDIGVAMGQRGSDVSREVADVILLDDNFATIVAAIEEGRSIYENIQKFIRFFFSTDLALIALMIAGLAIAFFFGERDPAGGTFLLPLTAVQLLWINVIADGPPALALAFDRNPGVMNRPPRLPRSKLLDTVSLRFIVVSGAAKAAGGIGILALMPLIGFALEEMRTSLFFYESLLQLVFVYPCRRVIAVPPPNIWIHLAVGFGVVLQVLAVTVTPFGKLLGLAPVSAGALLAIALIVLLTWTVAELVSHGTDVRAHGEAQSR